jgi:SRSO17 transposase
MRATEIRRLDRELGDYLDSMTADMGRPERREAMAAYLTGLLLDGERKSIQPMAARLVDDASEIEAMRQRLQQCVTISTWSDEEMFRRLAMKLERELPAVEALVIDDTGFPKKGKRSVGVARQYSGTLGRVDNCQVAASLHLAGEAGSGCIGMRLFLPEAWANDQPRRESVGVPQDVTFQRKWEIALGQLDDAIRWGVRKHTVLADAGYGDIPEFRGALGTRGLRYVVGVNGTQLLWPPGSAPERTLVREPSGPGRRRWVDPAHPPISIAKFSKEQGHGAFRKVSWRDGSRGRQLSHFAAWRVYLAEHHGDGAPPSEPVWVVVQWPPDEDEPTKYWISDLPASTSLVALVRLAKLRWRVERDYQELKQEIGLDHWEGRTWRGFHHHVALCAVAHGFLALQRALFPPEEGALDAAAG